MVHVSKLILGTFAVLVSVDADKASEDATKPYVAPDVLGLHWLETFDGDVWSRWKSSSQERYNGKFEVQKRKKEALIGDVGLGIPVEARLYGASTSFSPLKVQPDTSFVVQFEVQFQSGLSCGGAYIKLFDSAGKDPSEFNSDTPYIIMFGPDKCGTTNKVHFILRHRSPVTNEWEEKHFSSAPPALGDQKTHLYALIIRPDNSFEIQIDGEQSASGDLLTSMTPSINPPKEIDDPSDVKPSDWIDDPMMPDPEVIKPDDWDEDAPEKIDDPESVKPEGWMDDAPERIPDPNIPRPDDWDDEEDGEWETPTITNPQCDIGCGKWTPARIPNPLYKGKWHPPQIENPAFIGVWKPQQIENPNYFLDESPALLPEISAAGFDLWTMASGVLFDNIVITADPAQAKSFADQSWKVRHDIEVLQSPDLPQSSWFNTANMAMAVTGVAILAGTMWFCCCKSSQPTRPAATRTMTTPRTADVTGDKPKESTEEKLQEATSASGAAEADNAESEIVESEEKEVGEKAEEKAEEKAVEEAVEEAVVEALQEAVEKAEEKAQEKAEEKAEEEIVRESEPKTEQS